MGEWAGWKNWALVTSVDSETDAGKTYEIRMRPEDGLLGCACVSYRMSKDNSCKHLRAFRSGDGTVMSLAALAKSPGPHAAVKITHAGETFVFARRAISFGGDLK